MFRFHSNKNTTRRKEKIFVVFFVLVLLVMPRVAHADVWGASMGAAIFTLTSEKIERYIQGALLAQLKLQAVRFLNSQVRQLVSGVNGSGLLFISNWQQYLLTEPKQQNQIYLTNLLTQTTRGKCSGLNYQSMNPGAFNTNFLTALCSQAQTNISAGIPIVNIDQYSRNPYGSMGSGNWRTWNAFFSNPSNNPLSYPIMVGSAAQANYAAQVDIARTKAIANQGYNSVEKNGLVVTPGRTIADIIANVETLGNNLIVNAKDPSEFVSGLIAGAANQAMNQLMQRGFAQVASAVQQQTNKINQKIRETTQTVNKTLGPASQYLQGTNQLVGNVNAINARYGGAPAKGCAGSASGYGGC